MRDSITKRNYLVECPHCKEIALPGNGGECDNCLHESFFAPSMRNGSIEEPAECLDYGLWCEADDLHRCSLDAFADFEDYDLFCPRCDSDNVRLHPPREDR